MDFSQRLSGAILCNFALMRSFKAAPISSSGYMQQIVLGYMISAEMKTPQPDLLLNVKNGLVKKKRKKKREKKRHQPEFENSIHFVVQL